MLLHQVPLIVGCSEAVVKPFRADGIPKDRLRVVYNGIDQRRLHTGTATGLRDSLGLRDTAVLIAAAGALVPIKGFDVLIRALSLVRLRGFDAHLAIAGEGPERQALEVFAADVGVSGHVHFLGQNPHIGAIFRDAADIVAVSSRMESFGLVAAEASALGRPVVATRVGGVAEWARDGETALLVPPNDSAALADALASLANDPERSRQLGARAMAHVLPRFTAERVARSFEGIYDEMLTRSAASYGWSGQGFRMTPFARLGASAIRRRLASNHSRPG
jgi:glycosyltransferase involved in cell wall biosynthesis